MSQRIGPHPIFYTLLLAAALWVPLIWLVLG